MANMKSIFLDCLICITVVSVSCSHSEELTGIVGGSIAIQNQLTKGTLMYKGTIIGDVSNGNIKTNLDERFTDRLQWDRSTGFFFITDLKKEDSGEYRVHNKDNGEVFLYQLTMYIAVSKPTISREGDSCSLQCVVERGENVTLSWYRAGEKESISSTFPIAPMSLALTAHKGGKYTCEVKNPASRETDSITVGKECTGGNTSAIVGSFIGGAATGVAVMAGVAYYVHKKSKKGKPFKDAKGQENGGSSNRMEEDEAKNTEM